MASADPQIVKIEAEISEFISLNVITVANYVAKEIHDDTPVRSGYARSNWVASVGAPETSTVGSKESVDSSRFATSLASLYRWTVAQGDIFITNAVDYIGRLANGSSAQAPSGFIDSAAARGLARAKAAAR